jgi:flagellar basal-body rod modification protein FlgD
MEINATSLSQTSASLALPSDDKSGVLSSDFETFLQMLTAQAKYQDPLEPIDSSEYASQLAQFSMVEQQVQSNELLSKLADKLGGNNIAEIASWIGMEARTTAPALFDGSPITISPSASDEADETNLVVYNDTGTLMQRQALPLSAETFIWAGVRDDGTPLENGVYTFAIESYANGKLISTVPAESYNRITEARNDFGNTFLVLNGGQNVPASAVTALRDSS